MRSPSGTMVIAQRRELKLLTLTGLGLDCDFITFMKMCVQACLDSYDINSEDHVNPNHNQEILKRRKKKHGIPTLPACSSSDSSQSQDTTWLFRKVREFPGWFWPEWERRKWQWFKWISEAKVTQMCSNKKYPDPYGRREREVCENRLSQTNLSNLSVNHQQSFYLNLLVKKTRKNIQIIYKTMCTSTKCCCCSCVVQLKIYNKCMCQQDQS